MECGAVEGFRHGADVDQETCGTVAGAPAATGAERVDSGVQIHCDGQDGGSSACMHASRGSLSAGMRERSALGPVEASRMWKRGEKQ